MAATSTLCGSIVVQKARPITGSPRCVLLDARIFVDVDRVLIGKFHFFNTDNISFKSEQVFAWVYVRLSSGKPPLSGGAMFPLCR
jgi:hypothetical protein